MRGKWFLATLTVLNFLMFVANASVSIELANKGDAWCFFSIGIAMLCLYNAFRCADLAVSE